MLTNLTKLGSRRTRGHPRTGNTEDRPIPFVSFQTSKASPSHRAASVSLWRPQHLGAKGRPHPPQGCSPSIERNKPALEVVTNNASTRHTLLSEVKHTYQMIMDPNLLTGCDVTTPTDGSLKRNAQIETRKLWP